MKETSKKVIGVIPARYGSSRFKGKPLALLGGRPVIQWVYEAVSEVLDEVWVATESEEIALTVERFGGRAVVSQGVHTNGTSRVHEALQIIGSEAPLVVNVQGDEPFVTGDQIQALVDTLSSEGVEIATLVTALDNRAALTDPNQVKTVIDINGNALYFSRSVIPYCRGVDAEHWMLTTRYYGHIGVYGYRREVLDRLVQLPPTPLETAESLEQLRWLEHGYQIRTVEVDGIHIGIDTPDDLKEAERVITNTN